MRPSKIEYHVVKLFHKHTKILNNLHNQYIKHVCENGGDILEFGFPEIGLLEIGFSEQPETAFLFER